MVKKEDNFKSSSTLLPQEESHLVDKMSGDKNRGRPTCQMTKWWAGVALSCKNKGMMGCWGLILSGGD
jgi:hypothetical protein